MSQLTPIEQAIYDFMAWLTTRKEKLILSSSDDSSPAAQAVKEYLDNFILEDAITVNRAEYEQLKADAERYQWLRDKAMDFYNNPSVIVADKHNEWRVHTYLFGSDLDKAIDQARKT